MSEEGSYLKGLSDLLLLGNPQLYDVCKPVQKLEVPLVGDASPSLWCLGRQNPVCMLSDGVVRHCVALSFDIV